MTDNHVTIHKRNAVPIGINILPTLCLVLYLLSTAANAKSKPGFPESLFGVKLGGIYTVGEEKDIGTMPVKEFHFMYSSGIGHRYYFKPLKDYKAFKYVEKRGNLSDTPFKQSFQLYLLPIIPRNITNAEEFIIETTKFEVTLIEWLGETEIKESPYFWAIDLCKSVKSDLEREPDITDNFDSKWYECVFTEAHKKLEISGLFGMQIFSTGHFLKV